MSMVCDSIESAFPEEELMRAESPLLPLPLILALVIFSVFTLTQVEAWLAHYTEHTGPVSLTQLLR